MTDFVEKYNSYISKTYSKEFITVIFLLRNEPENIFIDDSFNWEVFLRLVDYHKLYPVLFKDKLFENDFIPNEIRNKMKLRYEEKSKLNLHLTSQLIHLNKLIKKQNIDGIWLKGPVLAIHLYQQLNQRLSGDLDLLIKEKDILQTHKLLIKNEFQCELSFDKLQKNAKLFFKTYRNQLHYFNKEKRISLELHWRLTHPNGLWLVDFDNLYHDGIKVNIGESYFHTLSDLHYFIYLAAHGSAHRWFRLFWLKDIHEIFSQNKLKWNEVIKFAEKIKLINIIKETSIISNLFFNTLIPQELFSLNLNKKTDTLIIKILKRFKKPIEESQTEKIGHFNDIIYLTQLKTGFKYKMNCFIKLLINSEQIEKFNLPSILFPLYFFKRIFSWFNTQYLKK